MQACALARACASTHARTHACAHTAHGMSILCDMDAWWSGAQRPGLNIAHGSRAPGLLGPSTHERSSLLNGLICWAGYAAWTH
eukprot:15228964-Alexandrium_andersonii.AAC.1